MGTKTTCASLFLLVGASTIGAAPSEDVAAELAAKGRLFGAKQYGATSLEIDPGQVLFRIDGGRFALAFDQVERGGVYWAPLGLTVEGGVQLDQGSTVLWYTSGVADGASVDCAAGWYACCSCLTPKVAIARCRPNSTAGSDADCAAGGRGSTACGISNASCEHLLPDDEGDDDPEAFGPPSK